MKILKRNYGHRNLIIFLILSLVYLQAVYSLSMGLTFFSLQGSRDFIIRHYLILILTLATTYMVIKIKKYSEVALFLCLTLIVGKSFILLSSSFNKLTLTFNFLYLLFAFYFFILWEIEIGMAAFNARFSALDLEKESRFKLSAIIYPTDDRSNGVGAFITNIDEAGCFLLLSLATQFELSPKKKYLLETNYEGVVFSHHACIVSSYDRGVGFLFEKPIDTRVSWSELYKVCLERGLAS